MDAGGYDRAGIRALLIFRVLMDSTQPHAVFEPADLALRYVLNAIIAPNRSAASPTQGHEFGPHLLALL